MPYILDTAERLVVPPQYTVNNDQAGGAMYNTSPPSPSQASQEPEDTSTEDPDDGNMEWLYEGGPVQPPPTIPITDGIIPPWVNGVFMSTTNWSADTSINTTTDGANGSQHAYLAHAQLPNGVSHNLNNHVAPEGDWQPPSQSNGPLVPNGHHEDVHPPIPEGVAEQVEASEEELTSPSPEAATVAEQDEVNDDEGGSVAEQVEASEEELPSPSPEAATVAEQDEVNDDEGGAVMGQGQVDGEEPVAILDPSNSPTLSPTDDLDLVLQEVAVEEPQPNPPPKMLIKNSGGGWFYFSSRTASFYRPRLSPTPVPQPRRKFRLSKWNPFRCRTTSQPLSSPPSPQWDYFCAATRQWKPARHRLPFVHSTRMADLPKAHPAHALWPPAEYFTDGWYFFSGADKAWFAYQIGLNPAQRGWCRGWCRLDVEQSPPRWVLFTRQEGWRPCCGYKQMCACSGYKQVCGNVSWDGRYIGTGEEGPGEALIPERPDDDDEGNGEEAAPQQQPAERLSRSPWLFRRKHPRSSRPTLRDENPVAIDGAFNQPPPDEVNGNAMGNSSSPDSSDTFGAAVASKSRRPSTR